MTIPTIKESFDAAENIAVVIMLVYALCSLCISFTKSLIRDWKNSN